MMTIAEALQPAFEQEMATTRRLRLLDVPIPTIHGRSADEKWW